MELNTVVISSKQHRNLALLLMQATLLLLLLARPLHSLTTEFQQNRHTSLQPPHQQLYESTQLPYFEQIQMSSIDNMLAGKQHSRQVKNSDNSTLASAASKGNGGEMR